MDGFKKQLVAALLLGALLPQVMLHIASCSASVPKETEPTTAPTEQADTQPAAETMFIPVGNGDGVAQMMELENYILGVVLAEMPASFEVEALKAQAVVARTYTLRHMQRMDRHSDCAVCTRSSCCQAYVSEEDYLKSSGKQADVDKVRLAVDGTAGQVLTYRGTLAEATYFSCSGGRTEDAQAVWGENVAYLQAVDSPGEENAKGFSDLVYFQKTEFCEALGRELSGNPKSWFGQVTHTDGGGVATMFIGGISYSGTQLRKILGLNSTAFTVSADSGGVTITTRGKGHRVGMSQYGADAMAVKGSTYKEILAHYYPGTVIDNYGDLQ